MFECFCCCFVFLIKKNALSSFRLHLDQFIVAYRYSDSREMGGEVILVVVIVSVKLLCISMLPSSVLSSR